MENEMKKFEEGKCYAPYFLYAPTRTSFPRDYLAKVIKRTPKMVTLKLYDTKGNPRRTVRHKIQNHYHDVESILMAYQTLEASQEITLDDFIYRHSEEFQTKALAHFEARIAELRE